MLGVRHVEHIGLGGGCGAPAKRPPSFVIMQFCAIARYGAEGAKIFITFSPMDHVDRRWGGGQDLSSRAGIGYVGTLLYIGVGSGCGAGEDITVIRHRANGG